MSKIYKAVAYLRISNADGRDGESESLSNQRRFIEDFVKNQEDIQLVTEKLDDGVSGLIFDRPQFKEMMEIIEDGEVDCVIVRDLSRLGRDYVQTGEHLRKIFPQLGIRFISILDNIDTLKESDLGGMLDVTLKTILNDSYSRDISKKTRSAIRIKQQKGDFVGATCVYGYKKSPENKNQLIIDEVTAPIIRQIYSMKIDGYSANKISQYLNENLILSPLAYKKAKGLPTPRGGYSDKEDCQWSVNTILRILQDSTYIGTLTQGKETTYSYKLKKIKKRPPSEWAIKHNAHKAIISKNDFDLVQKLMSIDTRTSPTQDNLYIFSGLLYCKCCGCPICRKIVPYQDKKYVYYGCNVGRKKGCTTKMIKEETLIDIVRETILAFVKNVADLEGMIDAAGRKTVQNSLIDRVNEKIAANLANTEEVVKFKSSLYENLLSELISKDEYKELKQNYDRDLERFAQIEIDLQEEYRLICLNDGKNPDWMEEFLEFRNMTTLTRRVVVQLVQSISIGETIHFNFRFQDDYNDILEILSGYEEVG